MKKAVTGVISITVIVAISYMGYSFYQYSMRLQAFAYTAKGLSVYANDIPPGICQKISNGMNVSMTPDMISQRINFLSQEQAKKWDEYFRSMSSASAQQQREHFISNHILDLQIDAYKAAQLKPRWKRPAEFSRDLLNNCM